MPDGRLEAEHCGAVADGADMEVIGRQDRALQPCAMNLRVRQVQCDVFIEKRVAELEAEFKAAACTIEEIDQSEVASAVGDSMTKGMELQTAKKCLLQLQARQ